MPTTDVRLVAIRHLTVVVCPGAAGIRITIYQLVHAPLERCDCTPAIIPVIVGRAFVYYLYVLYCLDILCCSIHDWLWLIIYRLVQYRLWLIVIVVYLTGWNA
jgi:hypothetical protein